MTGMAEYIERRAAHDAVVDAIWHGKRSMYSVANAINSVPNADVAPVAHGMWDDEHKCTVCQNEAFYKISNIRPDYDYDWEENLVETGDYIWDIEWVETAYCPNCGAKMDLEDSECDT